MPVFSLLRPVGIINAKPMRIVQTKQALHFVTFQAKRFTAVDSNAEGESQGSCALEREAVRVFILIHD